MSRRDTRSRVVQAIQFSAERWTLPDIREWLRDHDYRGAVRRYRNHYRATQRASEDFDPSTFRVIRFGDKSLGIQATVGALRAPRKKPATGNLRNAYVNMPPAELLRWRKDARSRLASTAVGHESLRKLYGISQRAKENRLTAQDMDWLRKVRGFNARHLKQIVPGQRGGFGKEVGKSGYSARHIALRNWGHDPAKKDSPAYEADRQWLKAHPGAQARRRA